MKTCAPIWLRHWQECKQLHTKKPAQCGLRLFLSVDLPAVAVPEADPILNRFDQNYLDTRTPFGVPVPFANQVEPKPVSRGVCMHRARLIAVWQRVVEKTMKYKLLSGVLLAVAASVVVPNVLAAQPQALASDGADHVGAGAVAADGADRVGAGALAADGADRTGVNRVAYSRVGVGSDRVASALMTGSYSDQFNSPQ